MTIHQLYDYASGLVVISSVVGSALPPYEWFAPWPRFQQVYRIIKMTIQRWSALNLNSIFYPSIQQPPKDSVARTDS